MTHLSKQTFRVFIPGREVTKGKINEAIRRQIPAFLKYKFDSTQFLSPDVWEEGEFDTVTGHFVSIEAERIDVQVKVVSAQDAFGMREGSEAKKVVTRDEGRTA